ncbi:MAG: hypothetical protein RL376_1645, partial [Verrucomicrobiota bacterium]
KGDLNGLLPGSMQREALAIEVIPAIVYEQANVLIF